MSELHILVAEDSQNWQRLATRLLQRMDTSVHVDVASNYGMALQFIASQSYDLAVVDLSLISEPDGPIDSDSDYVGVELIRQLRSSSPDQGCGLIVLTAYPFTARLGQMLHEYGVYATVDKSALDATSFVETARRAIIDAIRSVLDTWKAKSFDWWDLYQLWSITNWGNRWLAPKLCCRMFWPEMAVT